MADSSQTGLYDKMMKVFKEDPTKLWTHGEFAEDFDIEVQSAQNGVFYLYRDGKIQRRVDKHPESRQFQYALEIDEGDSVQYTRGSANLGKRKNEAPIQRIRATITQIMNQLAELEDDIASVTEDMEVKMKKIEDILR